LIDSRFSDLASFTCLYICIIRLDAGHDLLGDHLEKLNLAPSNICCTLCKLDKGHLFKCTKLKDHLDTLPSNMGRDEKEASLYWVVRYKMTGMSSLT
jgi:hypothetical protein